MNFVARRYRNERRPVQAIERDPTVQWSHQFGRNMFVEFTAVDPQQCIIGVNAVERCLNLTAVTAHLNQLSIGDRLVVGCMRNSLQPNSGYHRQ